MEKFFYYFIKIKIFIMKEVMAIVWNKIKEHSFIIGCVSTFTICSTFFGFVASSYLKVNEVLINNYELEISRLKNYEEKFEEGVKAQLQLSSLQVQYEELQKQYNTLVGENWKQKYDAEYIRNLSLTEQLTLDTTRLNDVIARIRDELIDTQKQKRELEEKITSIVPVKETTLGEGLKAFDELLLEKKKLQESFDALKTEKDSKEMRIAELSDKLHTAEQEVERLRNLIQQTSQDNNKIGNKDIASNEDVNKICAAVENILDESEAAKIIIDQIILLDKKIFGDDFTKILNAADFLKEQKKVQIIVDAAPYLIFPMTSKTFVSIFKGIVDEGNRKIILMAFKEAQATQAKIK